MASNDAAQFFGNGATDPGVTDSRSRHHPDGDGREWDVDFEDEGDEAVTKSRGDEWSGVRWPQKDEESPEYRHLAASALAREQAGTTFELTPQDLELLVKANGFVPKRDHARIIFGLRGCSLVVAKGANAADEFKQIGRKVLMLKDVRPNHQHFRCVIGVWDLQADKLSAFISSTVPCRQAVQGYANGLSGSNMLPTGCYAYVCGPHKDRQGCLREDEDFCVLRSRKDTVFDLKDNWDFSFPADNLHPAFANKSAQFSSWGCQTIRGNHSKADGSFSGEYNEFRNALGLAPRGGSHGEKYSYVMLTGLEAAIASKLRKTGKHGDAAVVGAELGRLRHGSRGDLVKALQEKLGIEANGVFSGAVKKALVERQRKDLGWADGVFGPEMDGLLKLGVLKPAAQAPVAQAPASPPTAPAQPAPPAQTAPSAPGPQSPPPPQQQTAAPQPAPAQQAPVQQAPVQQAPVQQAPPQQAPAQQAPAQQAPAPASAHQAAAPQPAATPPQPTSPQAISPPTAPPPAPQQVTSPPTAPPSAQQQVTSPPTAPLAAQPQATSPPTAPPAAQPQATFPQTAPTPAQQQVTVPPTAPPAAQPPAALPQTMQPPAQAQSAAAVPAAPGTGAKTGTGHGLHKPASPAVVAALNQMSGAAPAATRSAEPAAPPPAELKPSFARRLWRAIFG